MEAVDHAMKSTYEKIAHEILALWEVAKSHGKQQLLIGFAGPPGAGKTTTVAEVCKLLPCSICIPMDGYHYTKAQLSAFDDPSEAFKRRGAHWTFNCTAFLTDLQTLHTTGRGVFPSFDHGIGDPIPADITVTPENQLILIEGNYLLLDSPPWSEIKSILDFSYFIECPLQVAEERVRLRHMAVGSTLEAAEERVKYNDSPNAQLVLACKHRADRIVQSL